MPIIPIGNNSNQQNSMNNQINEGSPQTEIVAGAGGANGGSQNNGSNMFYAYAGGNVDGNYANLLQAAYEYFYFTVNVEENNNNAANNNQQSFPNLENYDNIDDYED